MSIAKNVLANYVGQIYLTAISIVMMPVCLRVMGTESFGLIGFFAVLQAWFQLLDMGLSPAMARESARFNGGQSSPAALSDLLRAMELVFLLVALVGAGALLVSADTIAHSWLKVGALSTQEVVRALQIMAVVVGLRWVCGLYRGVVTGFEKLVWLNGFSIVGATAKFVLVIPAMLAVGPTVERYFLFQLAVVVLELLALRLKVWTLLPRSGAQGSLRQRIGRLRGIFGFSVSVAVTGAIWIATTQVDKLMLSNALGLSDYGFFTFAVSLAGGIGSISSPVVNALLPRLSRMAGNSSQQEIHDLYRSASQMVAFIVVPVAVVLTLFSSQVLWIWTGNEELTRQAAQVLSLYAAGSAISALSSFPYYLMFAYGDLRLHVAGSLLSLLLLLCLLLLLVPRMGAVGAGWAWLITNSCYFLLWVPVVHRKFFAGLHLSWLRSEILPGSALVLATGLAAMSLIDWKAGRWDLGLQVAAVSALLALISSMSFGRVRRQLAGALRLA